VVAPHAGDAVRMDIAMTRSTAGPSYTIQSKLDLDLNQYFGVISKDGKYLALTAYHSRTLSTDDPLKQDARAQLSFLTTDGALLWQFPLYAQIPAIAMSDDGSLVATARPNLASISAPPGYSPTPAAEVGVYVLNNAGKVVWFAGTFGSKSGYFPTVQLSHDSKYLVAGDANGNVYFSDIASRKLLWQRFLNGGIRIIQFESDGSRMYVESGDGFVYALDLNGSLIWRSYLGSWGVHHGMTRNYFMMGGKLGYFVDLLDKNTAQTVWQFPGTVGCFTQISPDESYVVVGGSQGNGTFIFDLAGGLLRYRDMDNTGMLAFGGNGSYMFMTGNNIDFDPQLNAGIGTTWLKIRGRDGSELWNSGLLDKTVHSGPLEGFAWISDDGRKAIAAVGNWVYFLAQQGPGATSAGVANAASYAPSAAGGVSPGELLTIFGQGLGPAQLTTHETDSSGKFTTVLAGTQVLFDDTPAPIVYTMAGVVSVVAPYDLAGKSRVTITLKYQNQASLPIEVPVVADNPALFTLDGSGKSDASIVRPDGSPVNAANPAAPGDILVLYAQGYGVSSPALPDGQIVNATLPKPAGTTTLLIDGQPIDTQYCGSAPGMVNGVLQINFRVPAVSAGSHQIQLRVGGRTSPAGTLLRTR
jgi:uncharacterized protein (TIGR03437 family)